MKAVLLSIHPKYCHLIAKGEKTIEVRKSKPKLCLPFKCYIYCTASDKNLGLLSGNCTTDLIVCSNWKTAIPVGGEICNGKVRGVDAPRNCRECDYCCGTLSEGFRCKRLDKWLEINVETKRDSDCPIEQVSTPHGDLIDKNDIEGLEYIFRKSFNLSGDTKTPLHPLIDNIPITIKAEEVEE